jgi:hypothetical protein
MLTEIVRFSLNLIDIQSNSTDVNPNMPCRISHSPISSQFMIWWLFSVAIPSDTSIRESSHSTAARHRTWNYFDRNVILNGDDFDWWQSYSDLSQFSDPNFTHSPLVASRMNFSCQRWLICHSKTFMKMFSSWCCNHRSSQWIGRENKTWSETNIAGKWLKPWSFSDVSPTYYHLILTLQSGFLIRAKPRQDFCKTIGWNENLDEIAHGQLGSVSSWTRRSLNIEKALFPWISDRSRPIFARKSFRPRKYIKSL